MSVYFLTIIIIFLGGFTVPIHCGLVSINSNFEFNFLDSCFPWWSTPQYDFRWWWRSDCSCTWEVSPIFAWLVFHAFYFPVFLDYCRFLFVFVLVPHNLTWRIVPAKLLFIVCIFKIYLTYSFVQVILCHILLFSYLISVRNAM